MVEAPEDLRTVDAWSRRGGASRRNGPRRHHGTPLAPPRAERHPCGSRFPLHADVVDLHRVCGRKVSLLGNRTRDGSEEREGSAAPLGARPQLPRPRKRTQFRHGRVPGDCIRDPGTVRYRPGPDPGRGAVRSRTHADPLDHRGLEPGAHGPTECELVHTVVKFQRENPGTAILLDDLDYLAIVAGFDAVARFVKRVTNQASASKGTVILAAGLGTFAPDQLALLRGSVDQIVEVQETLAPTTPGAEHVLMTINAQDAPVALPLVGARRGLLLTTEHPTKARLRYGDRFEIVWVTDQPES